MWNYIYTVTWGIKPSSISNLGMLQHHTDFLKYQKYFPQFFLPNLGTYARHLDILTWVEYKG